MYAFFSSGNYTFFRAGDRMFTPQSKYPIKAIDFYKDLVKFRDAKDVFIVDPNGRTISF